MGVSDQKLSERDLLLNANDDDFLHIVSGGKSYRIKVSDFKKNFMSAADYPIGTRIKIVDDGGGVQAFAPETDAELKSALGIKDKIIYLGTIKHTYLGGGNWAYSKSNELITDIAITTMADGSSSSANRAVITFDSLPANYLIEFNNADYNNAPSTNIILTKATNSIVIAVRDLSNPTTDIATTSAWEIELVIREII